jgi:hypothetical protein
MGNKTLEHLQPREFYKSTLYTTRINYSDKPRAPTSNSIQFKGYAKAVLSPQ